MKTNKTIMLLQTIGIIMVVCSHGCSLFMFNDIFPFGSFYMALFAFASGYFYNESIEKTVKRGIVKKVKKFILPYFFWNLIYGCILIFLQKFGMMQSLDKTELNFNNLFLEPFGSAHQFTFNLAAWFVIAIFLAQIIYILLRKLFKSSKKDVFIMVFLLALFYISIRYGNNEALMPYFGLIRCFYLLPFYHIGFCYNKYFERFDNLSNLKYFSCILIIQFIIHIFYDNIDFIVVWLNFKNVYWLVPLITGMTGIAFYLRICKILSEKIGNSKIINCIGNSITAIMYHHLFVFFIINIVLCLLYKTHPFLGFDINLAKNDIWYKFYGFNGKFLYVYSLLGILVPTYINCKIKRSREKYEKKT